MSRYPAKPPLEPGMTNQRKIEINPGEWIDYDTWIMDQKCDKRDWAIYHVTEEDRAVNIKRLQQIIAERFGRQRQTTQSFAEPVSQVEQSDDWEYPDEPF